jgi:hypothetical protein
MYGRFDIFFNFIYSHRTKRLSADFDQDLVDRLMKLSTSNGNEFFRPYKKGGAGSTYSA